MNVEINRAQKQFRTCMWTKHLQLKSYDFPSGVCVETKIKAERSTGSVQRACQEHVGKQVFAEV